MMKINCDMGESFGIWKMGCDNDIMPYLDMANIACGMHASDPLIMNKTIAMAKENNVEIGAHPGYPDLLGFGRRSLSMKASELKALFIYQIGALRALCISQDADISYIKPHGALYNDMMKDENIFTTLLKALASYDNKLSLIIMATAKQDYYKNIADKYGISLIFEAFVDRAYTNKGLLAPRNTKGSCYTDMQTIKNQVESIIKHSSVKTVEGNKIPIKVDTICIHGDGENALKIAKILKGQDYKATNINFK